MLCIAGFLLAGFALAWFATAWGFGRDIVVTGEQYKQIVMARSGLGVGSALVAVGLIVGTSGLILRKRRNSTSVMDPGSQS